MSGDPDWRLVRFVTRTAADPQWGGGVHRGHLAELAGLPPSSRALRDAIAIAWRQGRVDLVGDFVVTPPIRRRRPAARRASMPTAAGSA